MCVSVGVDGEEDGCEMEGEGGSICECVEGEKDSEEEGLYEYTCMAVLCKKSKVILSHVLIASLCSQCHIAELVC